MMSHVIHLLTISEYSLLRILKRICLLSRIKNISMISNSMGSYLILLIMMRLKNYPILFTVIFLQSWHDSISRWTALILK